MMYALLPALITYSPVVKSEGVFLALALLAMWVLLRWRLERNGWLLVVAGALLGLTFLTRGVGVAFVVGGLAFVVVAAHKHEVPSLIRGLAWPTLGLFSLGVGLVLAFQLALNVNYGDTWSVSGTDIAPLTLMFGTNRETRGGYNRADLERIGWNSEIPTERRRALDEATAIAYDRIRTGGFGFIGFALGEKMARLWEQEGSIARWSINDDRIRAVDRPTVYLLVDAAYVALLSLAVVGTGGILYRGGIDRPEVDGVVVVMVVVPLLGLGLLHMFFEVQPRYHLAFWPALSLFAAIAVEYLQASGTRYKRRFALKEKRDSQGTPARRDG
jgi:4-amino-4-deoxy-L-arabinose transferase-like glycosyltransferase